ncbi:hypothetical protein [Rubrivirga sp.]|uniref:hypothetical protein n=1 Tax=Rubrivirga sp. TaxID=1885344 RepID=UPI003C749C7B
MDGLSGIALLEAKLADTFALEDVDEARSVLEGYGAEEWHRERDRVWLAVIKQSGGSVVQLQEWVDLACRDYRDALAGAEYPESIRLLAQESSSPEAQAARRRDAQQYRDWLASSRSAPDDRLP